MAPLVTTMGLDPSLSHGALVRASWKFGPTPVLERYEPLFVWGKTKSTEDGLSGASTPEEMAAWGHRVLTSVFAADGWEDGVPLFIDWDERSVLWKGQGIYANKTSLLIGYLIRGFQARGTPVIVISPAEVRTHFGLSQRADKSAVWEEAGLDLPERTNSDLRDTLLLSYVGAASIRRKAQTSHG